jgi:CubicO group peptidase (beta-lactamase class C family)
LTQRYLFYPFILLISILAVACSEGKSGPKKEQKVIISFPKGKIDTASAEFIGWKEKIAAHYSHLHQSANFNGCVLVARQGVVIYKGCFGVKDVSTQSPLEVNDLFQIASVSKTFTAMAVLHLWDQGKISLDSKLKDYFPDISYQEVTIHDLLSHRSGLPNYLNTTEKEWESYDGLKSNADLLQYLIKRNPQIQALPGKKFAYNNTNYALLALIIEKVSGKPYGQYMRDEIFLPIGMNNTFVFSATDSMLSGKHITTGYLRKNQPDRLFPVDGIAGDKNIYSTVEDLLIWERATTHPGLFSKKVLEAAVIPRSHEMPGMRNYGYGWRLMERQGEGNLIYHNGWWHGYTAAFYKNPADETVIIVLSNIYNRNTYRVQPVWDILYGKNGDMGFDN